ncbi:MAG: large subunit ribosomal protein L25 [Candidatus Paceibacteria bacterium]|jgi:large subunit ribosomal protein L25
MTTQVAVAARAAGTSRAALPAGHIPAVVYGPKQDPISISVEEKTFDKIRKVAGESTILELTGLEEPIEVLIKSIDFAPTRIELTHVDFYAIERGKDMTTNITIELFGEAPAEKNNIGTVTKAMQDITVTCRPSVLPSQIDVDVSGLDAADSKITVADLPVLEGVTYDADPEEAVVVVSVAAEIVDEDPEEVDMDAIPVDGAKPEESEEAAA